MIPDLNRLQLPDLWQQEAIRLLRSGSNVIVDAPTGAGKTLVFESLVEARALHGQAVYTVPTRALANDKRAEWQRRKWRVGIATGEVADDLEAPVVVATLETQRDGLLAGRGPVLLVVDEYQMVADEVRGLSYELALAVAPLSTQLLLLSGSVSNAGEVRDWLRRLGRRCELVSTRVRPVPLDEMPIESLPVRAPAGVTGFWPRLAAEVLLADLGPLLIFAPRRAQAEKIARQIAMALPDDDPVGLTDPQRRVCGRELSVILEKRVAWHHSGLGYQVRAGVVEPLAKAGKLRVIVATTGLAAGINFSVRSVLVAETEFFDGRQERRLRRDELLQMFGRAGRRGLDSAGYLITTHTSPRLADGAALRLKRGGEIDWPPFLRVMHLAAERGESPATAAESLNQSLFSEHHSDLGFARLAGQASPTEPAGHAWFGLNPRHREVRNSRGEWEPLDLERLATGPLGAAFVWRDGSLRPALECRGFVRSLIKAGRVCPLPLPPDDEGTPAGGGENNFATSGPAETSRFGCELAIGPRAEGRRQFALTKQMRQWLGLPREAIYGQDEIASTILDRLQPHFHGATPRGFVLQGDLLVVRLDFHHTQAPLYLDRHGVLLAGIEERDQLMAAPGAPASGEPAQNGVSTPIRESTRELGANAKRASAALAWIWLGLGLISQDGVPTRRGVVTSFFHQGEGLAVAAGLEDEAIAIQDLIVLLANLRAGPRFSESATSTADPLALACRHAYGALDIEGYLSLGVPPGYGSGAAEVVTDLRSNLHEARRRWTRDTVGEGDIERVFAEWLSLLRHITHAPDHSWPRWHLLKAAAQRELVACGPLAPSRHLPDMPVRQLVHATKIAISRHSLARHR
ncbi:MAG: DEAD/DEAH box helicase [Verrucomicrobiales bacterium]